MDIKPLVSTQFGVLLSLMGLPVLAYAGEVESIFRGVELVFYEAVLLCALLFIVTRMAKAYQWSSNVGCLLLFMLFIAASWVVDYLMKP